MGFIHVYTDGKKIRVTKTEVVETFVIPFVHFSKWEAVLPTNKLSQHGKMWTLLKPVLDISNMA
jgi:hypothetical protein